MNDDNRNEVIAIPFHAWLKNPVELMVRSNMRSPKYKEYLQKYPYFEMFTKFADDLKALFTVTSLYTLESAFEAMKLTANTKDTKEIEFDYIEMSSNMDPNLGSVTQMELALDEMLSEDFIKKVYIYTPWISDMTRNYIEKTYPKYMKKIYFADMDFRMVMEHLTDATTIFVPSGDELMADLQNREDGDPRVKDIYFVTNCNTSFTPESLNYFIKGGPITPESVKLLYSDYFDTLPERFGAMNVYRQLKQVLI